VVLAVISYLGHVKPFHDDDDDDVAWQFVFKTSWSDGYSNIFFPNFYNTRDFVLGLEINDKDNKDNDHYRIKTMLMNIIAEPLQDFT